MTISATRMAPLGAPSSSHTSARRGTSQPTSTLQPLTLPGVTAHAGEFPALASCLAAQEGMTHHTQFGLFFGRSPLSREARTLYPAAAAEALVARDAVRQGLELSEGASRQLSRFQRLATDVDAANRRARRWVITAIALDVAIMAAAIVLMLAVTF